VLSTCPVGWNMTPTAAMEHLASDVMAVYPVGTYVDRAKGISVAMPMPTERRGAAVPGAEAGAGKPGAAKAPAGTEA